MSIGNGYRPARLPAGGGGRNGSGIILNQLAKIENVLVLECYVAKGMLRGVKDAVDVWEHTTKFYHVFFHTSSEGIWLYPLKYNIDKGLTNHQSVSSMQHCAVS